MTSLGSFWKVASFAELLFYPNIHGVPKWFLTLPPSCCRPQVRIAQVTPYGWKVARLFSRLESRVFRPAVAMFTANDAVLPFPLRASLDRVDAQMDELIYDAFPQTKAS